VFQLRCCSLSSGAATKTHTHRHPPAYDSNNNKTAVTSSFSVWDIHTETSTAIFAPCVQLHEMPPLFAPFAPNFFEHICIDCVVLPSSSLWINNQSQLASSRWWRFFSVSFCMFSQAMAGTTSARFCFPLFVRHPSSRTPSRACHFISPGPLSLLQHSMDACHSPILSNRFGKAVFSSIKCAHNPPFPHGTSMISSSLFCTSGSQQQLLEGGKGRTR